MRGVCFIEIFEVPDKDRGAEQEIPRDEPRASLPEVELAILCPAKAALHLLQLRALSGVSIILKSIAYLVAKWSNIGSLKFCAMI